MLLTLRERAAPSCARVCLLHCKLRALSLLISTKYFPAIGLLGLFNCISLQTVFSVRDGTLLLNPACFLRGISSLSVCLTRFLPVGSCRAGEGWHILWALSEPLNPRLQGRGRFCRHRGGRRGSGQSTFPAGFSRTGCHLVGTDWHRRSLGNCNSRVQRTRYSQYSALMIQGNRNPSGPWLGKIVKVQRW